MTLRPLAGFLADRRHPAPRLTAQQACDLAADGRAIRAESECLAIRARIGRPCR